MNQSKEYLEFLGIIVNNALTVEERSILRGLMEDDYMISRPRIAHAINYIKYAEDIEKQTDPRDGGILARICRMAEEAKQGKIMDTENVISFIGRVLYRLLSDAERDYLAEICYADDINGDEVTSRITGKPLTQANFKTYYDELETMPDQVGYGTLINFFRAAAKRY